MPVKDESDGGVMIGGEQMAVVGQAHSMVQPPYGGALERTVLLPQTSAGCLLIGDPAYVSSVAPVGGVSVAAVLPVESVPGRRQRWNCAREAMVEPYVPKTPRSVAMLPHHFHRRPTVCRVKVTCSQNMNVSVVKVCCSFMYVFYRPVD